MIKIQNVNYRYGARALLSNMNLELMQGSFHFLTGPSGSGKTTFLKLCYGDLQPTSGHLSLFGEPITDLNRDEIADARRRIGVVHQDCNFLDHLCLAENIVLPLRVSGQTARINAKDLQELLAWVGLAEHSQSFPPELSGGERQRAAIARAVIMDPDMILADEPTGNIDWEMSLKLMQLLVSLNKMGKTIVVATHDMALIRSIKPHLNARVLRIQNGGIQLAGADL